MLSGEVSRQMCPLFEELSTVAFSLAQMDALLGEVGAQRAVLATPDQAWRARLAGVAGVSDLVAALRDMEAELNVLGDGLPRGVVLRFP